MYIKDLYFHVVFSAYAERHFCKDFLKKYKVKKWLHTKQAIHDLLERAYAVQQTSLIDTINYSPDQQRGLFKLDFRVAGTEHSPKSSGNRAIFALCNTTGAIEVVLVYSKDHCKKNQSETQWILEQVKRNFSGYRDLC